jgi:hypothetical protein
MKIAAWVFACLVVSGCVTDEADDQDTVEDDPCAQRASGPIDADGDGTPDVAHDEECDEPLAYDSNGDMMDDTPFP